MGGDLGLSVNVEGALAARQESADEIILVGDEARIQEELARRHAPGAFRIQHSPTVIGMHEKPAEACRSKKDSSIMRCAELVAQGQADACVSAGNSGATMAAALLHMGRLTGVSRPAIAIQMPTLIGTSLVLDVGANVDCKPKHLLQFALMGSIYAEYVWNLSRPRVGLISIGEEEGKGNELTQATHELLKLSGLNYVGNAEGRDIPQGRADVFVCDGFVGNVILKFGEGLSAALLTLIKTEMKKHPLAILGKLLLRGAFRAIRKKTDPAEYGGAPLLGVNGAVIISHGGSNVKAIKNALRTAGEFVKKGVNGHISERLRHWTAENSVEAKVQA
jgi:phosphate acyltransferase